MGEADRRTTLAGLAGVIASLPAIGQAQARRLTMSKANFTAQGLAAVRDGLQTAVDQGFAPGVVALLDRGGQTEALALGAPAFGGPPMRRDTIFRIASMTKLVTAAAVMILVEAGKLRLDEPIDRLLPELANRRVLRRLDGPLDDTVPAARPITVEDLLTFRLGWGIVFGPPAWPINKAIADLGIVGFGMPNPRMPFTPDAWLAKLGTLPLMHQPGEAWMYTTGSNVQGALVARASGQPFDAFVAEHITGPLGMRDTGFFVPADKLDRLSTAYALEGGALTVFDDPAHSRYAQPPVFPEGDAGLTSTVDDLLAFSRMLLAGGRHPGGRLLSEASVQAMTRNHVTPAQVKAGNSGMILGDGHGWGYGMSVASAGDHDGLRPGAFGWSGGFGTSWYMDPARDLTMVLLTQRLFGAPDDQALHAKYWAASYQALA